MAYRRRMYGICRCEPLCAAYPCSCREKFRVDPKRRGENIPSASLCGIFRIEWNEFGQKSGGGVLEGAPGSTRDPPTPWGPPGTRGGGRGRAMPWRAGRRAGRGTPTHHGGRELGGVMMPGPSFPFPWPGQRGIFLCMNTDMQRITVHIYRFHACDDGKPCGFIQLRYALSILIIMVSEPILD